MQERLEIMKRSRRYRQYTAEVHIRHCQKDILQIGDRVQADRKVTTKAGTHLKEVEMFERYKDSLQGPDGTGSTTRRCTSDTVRRIYCKLEIGCKQTEK